MMLENYLKKIRGKNSKYYAVMIACFLYGGYAIISFMLMLTASVWRMELLGIHPIDNQDIQPDINRMYDVNRPNGMGREMFNPVNFMANPLSFTALGSGILCLLAGLTIWHMLRKEERKEIRNKAASTFLLPDENRIIETLRKGNGELTQAKLTLESGLSKVQVHRALKKLEDRELIEKHKYGLTNKIILKKELLD